MYHMLTGRTPFSDGGKAHTSTATAIDNSEEAPPATSSSGTTRRDTLAIIHSHLARIPPDVARSRKDLHPAIPSIVSKLMHKNPRQRCILRISIFYL